MKATLGEKWFYGLNYVILTLAALSCLLPILNIFALSFSDSNSILNGSVNIWPKGFNLEAYETLISGTPIVRAFMNSLLITVAGVAFSLLFTILAAYPLSRRGFTGRRVLTLMIVFTMLFNGGLIPNYLVVNGLGLVNTYWALWLPALVSAFNMMIMKNYFENLPDEIEEAARMDGCGEIRLILRIVLPLSLPMLATIALFYAVYFWNAFLQVMIYIQDTRLLNMTVLVQNMIRSQSMMQFINNVQPEDMQAIAPESVKSAGIVVMIIPLMLVYPFLQKYFVKGVMIGAVKG
ncbi:carbohydrate ABC transporter permease [Paenibacillus sp. IB182496]|uniref:Carbohydrate ABC transporter permease n=1 Tax=Paenibacillus sabuli TaxID=2772509 RepID=A0A927GTY9_9BACL|nr:carbohydrate ABC transporter permease [Paenibacillus sabuli]MBD2847801.1 carbohydrate ABC transporter permease [Paenibacillus sabuli]